MPTDPQNNYLPVKVPRGGGPYDDFVNNNFDKLTQNRVVSGPIADRPDPGLWAPQRWYATDEQTEYFNTGSSWEVIDSGEKPYYYLSDFDSLQTAIETASGDKPLFVDGSFTFSEVNIPISNGLRLFGRYGYSHIHVDVADTNTPLFEFADTTALAEHLSIEGIWFTNNNGTGSNTGGCGAFLERATGAATYVRSYFKDLYLRGFNGTYVFEIENAYVTYFSNIHITDHSAGGFHFTNCNASYCVGLQVHGGGDGATPSMYFEKCGGMTVVHPFTEGAITDAIMQVADDSEMTFVGGYHEQHGGSFNCVLQIGDGGETTGNTGGSTVTSTVKVFGGFSRRDGAATGQAFRLLNVDAAVLDGVHIGEHNVGFQVGNADGFSVSQTEIHRAVARNTTYYSVNNITAVGTQVEFVYESGTIFDSRPANADLSDAEYAMSRNGGGSGQAELYYKRGGTVNRWTANGTF